MESVNKNCDDGKVLIEFANILKLIIYSIIGIAVFFIPIKINGHYWTIIYHISYKLQTQANSFLEICIIFYVSLSCIKSIFISKKNGTNEILNYIRLFSLIIILSIFCGKNEIIFLDDNVSLLIYELVMNISTVFPISAIFITFLLDYGLLDVVESYCHVFMKKNFNLSGKTIINILLYISTDCFCGMFMTSKLYNEGKIRLNEACNIVLNFSILSIPMILYVSKELDIKSKELSIIVILLLLILNILMSRIYPIKRKKKSYFTKTNYKETIHKNDKLEKAIKKYLKNRSKTNIFKSMLNNLEESIFILMKLIPNLVLILYLGQIIINSNLISEIVQIIFNPILELLKIQNKPDLSIFIVNVFYNNIIAIDDINLHIQYSTRLLMAIIAVLNCTCLSSNYIYINNTNIKISKKEFLISYIQRIVLIILIYSLMYYFYRGYIM
ncbi:hypothetical protein [Romboutsia lituseburensis]|uniref:hypothetical protein n=1 Tax=Romboutsia lituseburensis TaxID=1537 RepID=UPI00215ABEF3|nr:hypothetical protein [Romboutsia lituseburensis]MCR8745069.1 hypothetical protein [Romboutsia lituseburensis]